MPKGRPSHKSTTEALNAYNRARSADWDSVDWRMDNRTIAAMIGRSYNTVAKKRVELGKSGQALVHAPKRMQRGSYPNLARFDGKGQAAATTAAKKSPLAGKCETNVHAKEWTLIAPNGMLYRIRNLYECVRQNTHLFRPADVVWKRAGGKRGTGGEYCNATAGILSIKSGKTKGWKGWKLIIK